MKRINSKAVFTLAALPLAISEAFAGGGWGDNIDISGAPIKVQTYYANSPSGMRPNPLGGADIDTGAALRKFVDTLPGLGEAAANNLGQYLPVAIPEKWVNGNGEVTNDDYYELAVVEYTEKMHSDLAKATRLRGYVQLSTAQTPGKHIALTYPDGAAIVDSNGAQVYAVDHPHYLGPVLNTTMGVAVRIKYTNYLPTGAAGDLFIPVDQTLPGAGTGPDGVTTYTQNRADIHWHGGDTPWVSDGTPHQWVAPAGETAAYAAGMGKGASAVNVPDMPDPGPGSRTLYFPNNLSGRFMFYHDHSLAITRLNVYAGMAAGYLVSDPVEQGLIANGVLPATQIPLVIQDKTFVPKDVKAVDAAGNPVGQDEKWDTTHWGQEGDLWFPHVYETNQDPNSIDATNPVGRWDWGPWFWPVFPAQFSLPSGEYGDVTTTPEAFMDTPLINGTAYPTMTVDPKAYRFRILNAANDRFINLGLYLADPTIPQFDSVTGLPNPGFEKEVKMVPAVPTAGYPDTWPTDGRMGGVPDPAMAGPDIIAVGNEGGFLPNPAIIASQPMGFEYNRRSVTVLNTFDFGLFMGPAERADVVIDFSKYAGKTLILYNDSPAPVPAFDPRIDYFTDDGDQTGAGGAGNTLAGYGPNTRTIMQIKVAALPAAAPYDVAALQAALPAAYAQIQDMPIVPEAAYNNAFGTLDQDNYAKISTGTASQPNFNFTSAGPQTLTAITLTGGGTGYKSAPTVVFNGGGGTGATATATVDTKTRMVTGVTLTNPGSGYTSVPTITFTGGGGIGATAVVTTNLTQSLPVQNKAIQELFEPIYGRMNATLGVELPYTSALTQTTIPLNYIDPATESIADGETQIWKITHNGVDTHPVHFHLVNVQVINRVGWDGTVKPPAENELGWKETVKMNPLEDIIVAVRSVRPLLPFGLPQSSRPMDPSQPLGSTLGFTQVNPTNNTPLVVANAVANYDNEYVWHCHILGHEENDFMRPIIFKPTVLVPDAPSNLTVAAASGTLTWTDPTPALAVTTLGNAQNEIGFNVLRSANGGAFNLIGTTLANATSWVDPRWSASYSYEVVAYNAAGMSLPSNIAVAPPAAPTGLAAGPVTPTSVTLTWADNAINEAGYQVWRNAVLIATLAANSVSYIDATVAENTTYSYEVRAVNAAGSASSGVLSVTTPLSVPLAPTGLAVTGSIVGQGVQASLSWVDNAFNEVSYNVQRGAGIAGVACDPNGVWTAVGTAAAALGAGSTLGYVDATAVSGASYCYRVDAVNVAGASAWNMTANAVTMPTVVVAPTVAAPTTLTATPNAAGTSVRLQWTDNAVNETAYTVEVSVGGGAYSTLATLNRTAAQRTATGGTVTYNAATVPGSVYTYRVTAINVTAGVTTSSTPVTVVADLSAPVAPVAPTALAARIATATTVAVTWVDNASTETAYVVEASVNGGVFTTLATLNRTAAQRTATGGTVTYNATVAAGNVYSYQVHAVTTAFGATTSSANAGPVTIDVSVPLAPANVAAVASAVAGSIVVTWADGSSNESGFTVQRSLLNVAGTTFGAWANVGTVAASVTTITDTGRISGRTYRYQVRANSPVGNSAYVGPSNSVVAP